jgi:hypothetical protein
MSLEIAHEEQEDLDEQQNTQIEQKRFGMG